MTETRKKTQQNIQSLNSGVLLGMHTITQAQVHYILLTNVLLYSLPDYKTKSRL